MNSSEKVSLPLIVKIQVVLAVVATVVTIALAAYIPTLVQRKNVSAKPNFIAGHDDIRQRQYEIWFAPNSP